MKRLAILFLLCATSTWATCTGSSPTWTCPADSNLTSLRNLLSGTQAGLQRNDTVNIGAGAVTLSSTITITQGISLIGAGAANTKITSNTTMIQGSPDATSITNSDNIKISGFTFDGNNTASIFMDLAGASGITGTKPYRYYIIINNTFQNMVGGTSNGTITAADPNGPGQLRGVIANNTFDRCDIIIRVFSNNDPAEDANTAFNNMTGALGTEDNLYFENNTIKYSSAYSDANNNIGWSESGQGGRLVMRYNHYDLTNTNGQGEFNDIHGFQNMPGGQTGTMVTERYGNTYVNMNKFRCVDYRGGAGMVFNNTFSGASCDLEVYGMSSTTFCPSNISPVPTNYNPLILVWAWNNQVQGAESDFVNGYLGTFVPPGSPCGIGQNNTAAMLTGGAWTVGANSEGSWWNLDTAHCTGAACTQGIGEGTAVPTGTCTKGTGYWVSSTPGITTDPNVIQNSKFYVCTTTNTWTQYYTPFTYPHPLVGAAVGPTLSAPAWIVPALAWQPYGNSIITKTNYGGTILYIDGGSGGSPYTCTLASGSLPPGLTLQSFTPLSNMPPLGVTSTAGKDHAGYCILGDNTTNPTPNNEATTPGEYTFTINVTDNGGNSTISAPITFEVMAVWNWNSYTSYFQQGPVIDTGNYYQDKGQPGNINKQPSLNPTFWTLLGSVGAAPTMPTITPFDTATPGISVSINGTATTATFTTTGSFDSRKFAVGQFFALDQNFSGTNCSTLYNILFQVTTYSLTSITSTTPVPGVPTGGTPPANQTASGCDLDSGAVVVQGTNTPDKEITAWTTDLPSTSYVCIEGGNTYVCTPEQDTGGVTQHIVTAGPSNLTPPLGFQQTGLRCCGLSYNSYPFSRGLVSGAPKKYVTNFAPQAGIPISSGNPLTTGNVQMSLYGRGATKVIQGYPYYHVFYPGQIQGISGTQSVFFQVTGVPANMSIYWPDSQDWGNAFPQRSSVTTNNDTARIAPVSQTSVIGNTQFELIPTGTVPLGNNTLTVTAYIDDNYSNNGAQVSGVNAAITGTSPNQTVTFTGIFNPAQWPAGQFFRTGINGGTAPCTTGAAAYSGLLLQVTGVSTSNQVTAHVNPVSTIGTGSPSATGCTLFTETQAAAYNWPLQVVTPSFVAGSPSSPPALPTNTLAAWQADMIGIGGYPCTVASVQELSLNQWQVTCTTTPLFLANEPITFNGTLVNACFLNFGTNPCNSTPAVAGPTGLVASAATGNTFKIFTSATSCPGCPATYPLTNEPATATASGSWLYNLFENKNTICAEIVGSGIFRSDNGQECVSYYDGTQDYVQIKAYDRANQVTSDFNLTDANSIWNIGIFNSYAQEFNGVSQVLQGSAVAMPAIWGPGHGMFYNDIVGTPGNADPSANANLSYKGVPVSGGTGNPTLNTSTAFAKWINTGQGGAMLASQVAWADGTVMRECGYSFVNKRLAYDAGNVTVTVAGGNLLKQVASMASLCTGHADQTVNTPIKNQFTHYMGGLMARALIEYYEDSKIQTALVNGGFIPNTACTTITTGVFTQCDARVPDAVQTLADNLWTNYWIPWLGANGMVSYYSFYDYSGFSVSSNGNSGSTQSRGYQSLSMLLAPMYSWLYLHTGNSKYAVEGDYIWSSGTSVDPSALMLFAGKEFSQQYYWSFDYPLWRTPPSTATTAPTLVVNGTSATATSGTLQPSNGAIICWNTTGAPSTNGLGTDCKNGTPMINGGSSITGNQGQTVFAVAGSSTHTDSAVTSATLQAPLTATLTPSTIAFGNVVSGTTSNVINATLTNGPSSTLTINSVVLSANFARSGGTCSTTLAPSASCTIGVVFQPTAIQPYTGTLTVNDSASNSPQQINLTGTGLSSTPTVTLTPNPLNFGNQNINTTSGILSATLTNTGAVVVNITTIVVPGPWSRNGGTCGTSLAVGASCTIGVTFTPNATGPVNGLLSVNSNAQGSPTQITLAGTGTAPIISWSSPQGGTTFNYGNVAVGLFVDSNPLTLTNTGTGSLNVALSITGTNAAQFSITSTNCPAVLPAGNSCTAIVRFTPAAAQSYLAFLKETDSVQNINSNLNLNGTGVTPAPQQEAPWPPIILGGGHRR